MQNVLKSKICIFEGFRVILIFYLKSYVLDHSESTDMHIEELCKHVRNFFYYFLIFVFQFANSSLINSPTQDAEGHSGPTGDGHKDSKH